VLYPPLPLGDRYRSSGGNTQPYILSVGRICRIKRLDLIINALPLIEGLSLKIVGVSDEPGAMEYFKNEISKHNLESRVEFLGRVGDDQLLSLYADATGVFYAPFDEDYGYVTLEGMASGRPIVTASDSGGTLEFVQDGKTGFVVSPTPEAIANAFNILVKDRVRAEEIGRNARSFIESSGMLSRGWDDVIDGLLSPLVQHEICKGKTASSTSCAVGS
jgi:glycosyltransferase involved in cell wall biosynthesis